MTIDGREGALEMELWKGTKSEHFEASVCGLGGNPVSLREIRGPLAVAEDEY